MKTWQPYAALALLSQIALNTSSPDGFAAGIAAAVFSICTGVFIGLGIVSIQNTPKS